VGVESAENWVPADLSSCSRSALRLRRDRGHGTTSHGRGEYVNLEDRTIHSNTVEGYFSIFKRGMKGVYQHCGEQHLHRYLVEYEFRYNHRIANGFNDGDRSEQALKGIVGKRLTYKSADHSASA
jgi:hypothetical protein